MVLTNHHNLTYDMTDHARNQVLKQRLFPEEYRVEICYIKGEKNVVVDTHSQLSMKPEVLKNVGNTVSFLNLQVFEDTINFPLNFACIEQEQQRCSEIQRLRWKQGFTRQHLANIGPNLLHHRVNQIAVHVTLHNNLMVWYRNNLQHPGQSQMHLTIKIFCGGRGKKGRGDAC